MIKHPPAPPRPLVPLVPVVRAIRARRARTPHACTGPLDILPEFLDAATTACGWSEVPTQCMGALRVPEVAEQQAIVDALRILEGQVPLGGAMGAVFRLLAEGNTGELEVLLQRVAEYQQSLHEVQMMVQAVESSPT